MNDGRFKPDVEMGGEPPLGLECAQEPEERRRAEIPSLDVLPEKAFAPEEPLSVAVVLDGLGPVVREENAGGGKLVLGLGRRKTLSQGTRVLTRDNLRTLYSRIW